jgi:hypothetical protein
LIRVAADEQMWAQSYEGELRDTLALQSEVAQAVAEQIRATLSRRQQALLRNRKTVSPAAYEDYFKGRYFWNKRTGLKKAGLQVSSKFIAVIARTGLYRVREVKGSRQWFGQRSVRSGRLFR